MSAPENGPLQFDTAGSAPASAAVSCATCQRTIPDTYFEAGGQVLCTGCKDALLGAQQGGSALVRVLSALLLGIVACGISAVVWYFITELTGYELGIVAVAVGVFIGAAVRVGAKGRGGWLYQAIAILLTYLAIASSYVPHAVEAFRDQAREARAAAANGPAAPAAPSVEDLEAEDFAILATAIVLSLAWPVLQVMEGGFIGFLIVGFALYEAWKLNRRGDLSVQGPFRVASAS